jgi:uncharacterized membrane protein
LNDPFPPSRRIAAVVVLCCVALAVGWWSKARCLVDDGGWRDGEQYFGWCYTDIVPLYVHRDVGTGAVPYVESALEYPVLTGAQIWLAGLVADSPLAFFHVTAVAGAAFVLATIAVLAWAGVRPGRLVWMAGAPTLAAYAFLNWDPLPALLLTVAIVAHVRGADVVSGVAAGLGAAAKLFPAVVVPLVVAARLAQGRRRDALGHAGAAVGAWLVVNAPVMVLAPEGWARFLELNRERVANWDSLWYLASRIAGVQFAVPVINRWSALLFVAGGLVIAAVGMRRRDPARWWELALPILCWFLLVNKVYSPQYSLWLLPLLVLALPRPEAFWAFAVADLWVFVVEYPFLGGQVLETGRSAPGIGVFAFAFLVRAAVLVWITAEATWRSGPGLDALPAPAHLDRPAHV